MNPDFLFGVSQFTTNPWTFEQDIEAYARLGVQAIEVCEFKLTDDAWQQQMSLPAAHGLAITSIQPVVRTLFPSLSQPVPQDIESRMARFRQSIERLAPYAPGTPFVTNTGIAPNGSNRKSLRRRCASTASCPTLPPATVRELPWSH